MTGFFPHCMSQVVAQMRHPKHAHQCLLIEEQRTRAVGQDRSIEASLK